MAEESDPLVEKPEETAEEEVVFPEEYTTIDVLADTIRKYRLGENYSCNVVITGFMGKGKSTLAHQLARRIDPRYSIERNFIFDPTYDAISKAVLNFEKRSAPIIDEAIKSFYRQDWFTEMQKSLMKLFVTSRKQEHVILLCIPRFTSLRTDFRNDVVDFWIHVPTRGLAVVFIRDPNPLALDPWHVKENNQIWEKITRHDVLKVAADITEMVKALRKLAGYIACFTFDKMTEEEERKYLELWEQYKHAIGNVKEPDKREKKYRACLARAVQMLHKDYNIAQARLANELGLSPLTIRSLIEEGGEE